MMFGAHRKLLLPLCDPDQYRDLAYRLTTLERFEHFSPQDQAAIQERRIRALLDHAYKTSPYYRLIFDEMQFRSSDWEYGQPIPLPELNREVLRANMESLCSRRFRPDELRRFSSSGSPPTALWRNVEAHREKAAMECHLNRLSGIEAASMFEIRPAERNWNPSTNPMRQILEERILGRVTAFLRNPDDEGFRSLLDRLNRHKPKALSGSSSLVATFAEWLRNCGAAWHKPRRVITTGETPSQENRRRIVETFGCATTAQYGCPDIGLLGTECRQGERLHFHPWQSYVSLVPVGHSSEGNLYRLVITDLLNYGMPLIRYDSGDCVLFDESPCACGCWYPSITAVVGPAIENLILPDGTMTAGSPIVAGARRSLHTVRDVQLIQKERDSMHLRFSSGEDSSAVDRELRAFRRNIEDAFRIPLHWTIEHVAEIPRERSGIIRVAICEVGGERRERGSNPAN